MDYSKIKISDIECTDELMHYGVLGMKWGVRRYQNEDGTLTEAGKKRELKQNKKETFLTGRSATVIGQAVAKSEKEATKRDYKYLKHPTAKNAIKKTEADALYQQLQSEYDKALSKYKEAAKKTNTEIKYDKTGKVSANVDTASEWAISGAITVGTIALAVAGYSPIFVATVPKTARQRGNAYYRKYKKIYRDMPLTIAANTIQNAPTVQYDPSIMESIERAGLGRHIMSHSSCDIGENYLAHFGILGMKWGKRNGPPYPLDKSDYSASEKKAINEQDSKADSVKRKATKINYTEEDITTYTDKYGAYNIAKLTDENNPHGGYDFDIVGDSKIDKKKIADFANNFSKHLKDINSQISDHQDLKDIYKTFNIDKTPSMDDFMIHEIWLSTFNDNETAYIDMWAPKLNLGGHAISFEYDLKNKKISKYMEMNG